MAPWSGRRAATKVSATIRCSCPTATTRTFGEMPSDEKHGLPPRGKGLSHRARAFLKLAEACLGCADLPADNLAEADRRPLASIFIGRSACRNAPIATSTAMCATSRSTSRASCAPLPPRSRPLRRACRTARFDDLLRRRHASLMQPATVGVDPRCDRTALARRTRCRGHARSQSDQRRSHALPRLPRRRRQSRVARRSGARRSRARELGRMHTAREALDAVGIARSIFERFSFDLIYARPRQDAEGLGGRAHACPGRGRRAPLALSTDHRAGHAVRRTSCRGQAVIPDDDTARALYDATQDICAAHGLPAYEISNHARPGGECRHNLVYWRRRNMPASGRAPTAGSNRGRPACTATERRPELAHAVEAAGHGLITDDTLTREDLPTIPADGAAARRGHRCRRFGAISGR